MSHKQPPAPDDPADLPGNGDGDHPAPAAHETSTAPGGGGSISAPSQPARRGKPPSAKTWAIRRALEALGGVEATDNQAVIARVQERDGMEVTGHEVSMQKTVLRKMQADEAARAVALAASPPIPAQPADKAAGRPGMLSAQDIRDFTALVKRLGLDNLRALLEMAEAMR
jgi:hypothetical protein